MGILTGARNVHTSKGTAELDLAEGTRNDAVDEYERP